MSEEQQRERDLIDPRTIQDLVTLARTQEKKRKSAPPVITGKINVVQKQKIDKFGRKEMHNIFVPLSEIKQYAMDGYEPVTNDIMGTKELVTHTVGGHTDVLVACSLPKYQESLQEAKARSDFQTTAPSQQKADDEHGAVTEQIEKIAPNDQRHKQIRDNPDSAFPDQ